MGEEGEEGGGVGEERGGMGLLGGSHAGEEGVRGGAFFTVKSTCYRC